jgi:enoyl-CoA hydratase
MVSVTVGKLDAHISLITLNRPDRLNAMTFELVNEMHDALDQVEDDPLCRVVVITGAGRGFCAGFDLSSPTRETAGEEGGRVQAGLASMDKFYGLAHRLRGLRQPVISAVNGPAAGGGMAIAVASDIRVAAESARFGVAFIRVGYTACDIGMSYFLPRLIGVSRAVELMLTRRVIDASEAERIGLVHEVVPDGSAVAAAERVARQIVANTPLGVTMTKEVLWLNVDAPGIEAAIAIEKRSNMLTGYTEDHAEAQAAWRERRAPNYYNR